MPLTVICVIEILIFSAIDGGTLKLPNNFKNYLVIGY